MEVNRAWKRDSAGAAAVNGQWLRSKNLWTLDPMPDRCMQGPTHVSNAKRRMWNSDFPDSLDPDSSRTPVPLGQDFLWCWQYGGGWNVFNSTAWHSLNAILTTTTLPKLISYKKEGMSFQRSVHLQNKRLKYRYIFSFKHLYKFLQ